MYRFKDILFVLRQGEGMMPGLLRAAGLARANGGRLTLAQVMEVEAEQWMGELRLDVREVLALVAAEREAEVAALVADVEALGILPRKRILWGKPFVAVIQEVLRQGHDLVVKVADGPARRGRWRPFGSLDQHLMRKCPCPVWLLNPEQDDRFQSVLAAVDLGAADRDEMNVRIVQIGSSLAVQERAAFHVVHAWSLYGESILRSRARGIRPERLKVLLRENRADRCRRLRRLLREEAVAGSEPVEHLLKAPAALAIRFVARRVRADVVVMGTLSRSGIPGLLIGNTAETVLSRLDTAVLTVKPAGFQSPIRVEEEEQEAVPEPATAAGISP
jgi:universal stress protein E